MHIHSTRETAWLATQNRYRCAALSRVQVFQFLSRSRHPCVKKPAREAINEDDGYVLSYVYSPDTHSTSLWIMDGHNISNVLAKVQLAARVPQGFHGLWLPMEEMRG